MTLTGLRLHVDEGQFVVHGEGAGAWLVYTVPRGRSSPSLTALRGPSARNVLEAAPPDHPHHRGVWWGHGDVSGVDVYLETAQHGRPGRVVHRYWEPWGSGTSFGFVEDLDWLDDEDAALLRERRTIRADFTEGGCLVDVVSERTAVVDLVFGATKEAAMPGVRVCADLSAARGGTVVSSEGGVAESGCLGRRLRWLDHSAPRRRIWGHGNVVDALSVYDHPSNPGYPNAFSVRDYGLSSPRPGHRFSGGCALAAGTTERFRHGLEVHGGDVASVDERWARWAASAPDPKIPTR